MSRVYVTRPPEVRFWEKVQKGDGCWLWTGRRSPEGYGRFSLHLAGGEYGQVGAHCFAYELMVGPIPPGLVLDHVKERGCTNRHCVNPAHLEPVTRGENVLRGDGLAARHARKDTCDNGHKFTPENTYLRKGGGRECRACDRTRARQARRRRRDRASSIMRDTLT